MLMGGTMVFFLRLWNVLDAPCSDQCTTMSSVVLGSDSEKYVCKNACLYKTLQNMLGESAPSLIYRGSKTAF